MSCAAGSTDFDLDTMPTKPSNPKDMVGVKKTPMSVVSAPVVAEIGLGMLEGMVKYGRHNYRAVGVRASVYYDATMRHMMAWWEGEDMDPESDAQLSHVSKAIASLVVLRDAMIQGKLTDDRPPSSPSGWMTELNAKAKAVVEQHADKSPRHYTIADNDAINENRAASLDRTGSEPEAVRDIAPLRGLTWVEGPPVQ